MSPFRGIEPRLHLLQLLQRAGQQGSPVVGPSLITSRTKAIVTVKAGRSSQGALAASSHTGSLAGGGAAADALLKECGVQRVNSVEELFARRYTPAFRRVMVEAVDYAEGLFQQGLPLIGKLDRRLSLDIDLFSRGGMQVLRKIRSQDYNVLASRPAISKSERAWLLLQSLFRLATRKAA